MENIDFKKLLELMEVFSEKNIDKLKIKSKDFEFELKKEKKEIIKVSDQIEQKNNFNENIEVVSSSTSINNTQTSSESKTETTKKDEKAEEDNKNIKTITSPIVGTFYRAPAPGEKPFVEVGERVKKGDVLCIIEAMKVMNKIESEYSGVIKEILVENAQPVEYGTPIFKIEVI